MNSERNTQAYHIGLALEHSRQQGKVDYREVYRARGFGSQLDQHDREAISAVIERIDFHSERANIETALEYVDRLIGYLSQLTSRTIDDQVEGSAKDSNEIAPTFALRPEDKARVLHLSAEMRRIILASQSFDESQKRRLLNRINAIEKQVHQPRGLFDVFLGGLNDFGEAAGRFGTDAKPLFDRMTEMTGIVRRQTETYDQLPSPDEVKKLPKPNKDTGE